MLWFAIAAFLLFGQSISYDYTYLDDQKLVLNFMDQLKSVAFVPKAFTEDAFHAPAGHGYYYRPVLTLTFMTDAMMGHGSFSMFHVSNIIYHIMAAFLLFLFFTELGFGRTRSFFIGLLFLVHPMVTQAVAWVPGRNDTLLAIFVLGSFLSWLKFLKSGNSLYLVLHLLFFSLGLFTKENTIVLPVLIVFHSLVKLRVPVKKHLVAGVAWAIIVSAWVMARNHALGMEGKVPFSDQLVSVIKNLPAVLPFLGKEIFPFDLSVFPVLADMKVSLILGVATAGLLAALAIVTKPKDWFFCAFGLLWFLAFLVPSFVSINKLIPNFSEHRSYLSLAGILLFVMTCNPVKKANFSRPGPVSIILVICLAYSALTFFHTRHFKDRFAFWQNAVDTSPSNAFNYNNLGAMYYLEGDLVKAEPLFRRALEINPAEPMAGSNTGLICMNTDRPAEAEKYFLGEIRINPSYEHAYFNLGLLYYNHGRYDEGIRQWEKILTFNRGYTDAYNALLFAYEKLDRKADYGRILREAKENGIRK